MDPTELGQLETTGHYHLTLCKGPNTSRRQTYPLLKIRFEEPEDDG
jgi:hypothetical protein